MSCTFFPPFRWGTETPVFSPDGLVFLCFEEEFLW